MPADYASKKAKVRREDLRARIDASKCLKNIEAAEKTLIDWHKQQHEPSNGQVGALRLLVDTQFKKLAKILPDLKQVELTGEDGGEIMTAVRVELVSASNDKDDQDT